MLVLRGNRGEHGCRAGGVRGRAAAKVSGSSAGDTVEELVRDALRSPVFILGPHRSGTTLLYEMMHANGCFNIVTARHGEARSTLTAAGT